MTTTIKLPIRNLNLTTIRALKFQYPEAEISVEVSSERGNNLLNEATFWEIIGQFDWSKSGNDDEIVAPAIQKLAKGSIRNIYAFADLLSEKLFSLDGFRFAKEIGEDAWSSNQFFSVDNFLYARCCVVANGQDFYQKVLKTPAEMPKNLTFETILYLASTAFEQKTNRKWDYSPAFPIETFGNKAGWKDKK
jgi:hypothetical protein